MDELYPAMIMMSATPLVLGWPTLQLAWPAANLQAVLLPSESRL